jgi:concanavalin A-like lectin/glucanase superfamily protein
MSYESEVLADTPVVYYRLDQLGFGTDGETVPDLSGNDLDATLAFTGDHPAWGHVSPIDTDAASREFWGWTNAGIFGFDGVSHISRASDSSMQPTPKDFTVEEWLRPMDNIPTASDFSMVAKQNTGGTMLTFSGGTRIGGYCFDSAGTLFKVVDTSFLVTDRIGESFHVVVVRSGDALALYVNGSFRAVATVTSGLDTQFNSSPFRIHPDTLFYTNARHDEAVYYNYALSADRILAHYEAALNELVMRGESNIRTTAIINGTAEPDPIAYPFRHNWDKLVIERFRWKSSVFKPTDGATGLRRQRSAPRRQVEYQHLLYSERLRQQFEARSFAGRTALVQFEPDKVLVEGLSEGDTTATFDTRYRDFEVGHRVLFYLDDNTFEYATLTAVTDDGIEWDEPLSQDYTRCWVKPARVARLPLEQEVELQSDVYGDTSTIYEYLAEDEPLNPRRIVPFTPTLLHHGRECFDLAAWQGHNWAELPTITFTSDRTELDEGTGVVTTKQYRWGAEMTQPYNMNLQGRETIAQYLGWLYERAGQSNPFWMPTFRNDLAVVSRSGVELTVRGHEYTNLYANSPLRLDLAFVYGNNTTITRRIESATVDSVNDVLTLDSSVPTFTGLRWLSFLRRVVLSSDDLEIAWETDSVVRVAFAVVDAPLDEEFGSPSISPSPSASLSHSISPSASNSRSLSPSASGSPSHSTSPSLSPSSSPSPST